MRDWTHQVTRIAAGLGLLWLPAYAPVVVALGFGDIQVRSALNQPLDARVPLVSVSAAERDSLSVAVASAKLFRRFGIERTALAGALNIDVHSTGGGPVTVHLTTHRAVREPFLRFLLEADTSRGRTLREYTVLLDPPTRAPRSANRRPPAPAAQPPARATAGNAARRTAAARSPNARRANDAGPPGQVGPVSRGQTLFQIARRVMPAGATLAQTQIALYRANPQAFNGNMNLLLRGATLRVPGTAAIRAIDTEQALAQLRSQRRAYAGASAPASAVGPTRRAGPAGPAPIMRSARLHLEAPRRVAGNADAAPSPGRSAFGRLSMPDFSQAKQPKAADAGASEPDPQATVETASKARRDTPTTAGNDAPSPTGAPSASSRAPDEAMTAAAPDTTAQASPSPAGHRGPAAIPSETPEPGVADGSPASDPPAVALNTASRGTPGESQSRGVPARKPRTDSHASTVPAAAAVAHTVAQGEAATTRGGVDRAAVPDSPARGANTAFEQDVAGGESSLLSPHNLLLLALAVLLLGLLWLGYRRRQYRPLPLDFGASETAADPAASAPPDSRARSLAAADESAAPRTRVAPQVVVADADRQIKVGLLDQARQTLEDGLQQHPGHQTLQDKRLELDYLVGDAARFSADVTRFSAELQDNGVRWAGVAAMGQILLPDDPRFMARGRAGSDIRGLPANVRPTATAAEPPNEASVSTPAPAPEAPPGDAWPEMGRQTRATPQARERAQETVRTRSAASAHAPDARGPDPVQSAGDAVNRPAESATDDGLDLDSSAGELDAFGWEAFEIDTEHERVHDRGEEPGLSFELDTRGFPEAHDVADPRPDAGPPAPIDAAEYDLDTDSARDNGQAGDEGDPIDIRLDLARMYIDMQDKAAARELLEEAVAQGTKHQCETARGLLGQL